MKKKKKADLDRIQYHDHKQVQYATTQLALCYICTDLQYFQSFTCTKNAWRIVRNKIQVR